MTGSASLRSKACSKCGQEKSRSDFRARKGSRDGLHGWCNPCYRTYYNEKSRAWNEKNRDRRRELDRRRYWADPEKGRARRRDWTAANREVVNERARQAYYTNGGLEYARELRRKNPERFRAAVRRCYRKNRAKRLDWAHRRRLIEDSGAIAPKQLEALIARPCIYCGANGPSEIDHVVPLARGGLHELENLVPACRVCNASKGDRLLSEWLGVIV